MYKHIYNHRTTPDTYTYTHTHTITITHTHTLTHTHRHTHTHTYTHIHIVTHIHIHKGFFCWLSKNIYIYFFFLKVTKIVILKTFLKTLRNFYHNFFFFFRNKRQCSLSLTEISWESSGNYKSETFLKLQFSAFSQEISTNDCWGANITLNVFFFFFFADSAKFVFFFVFRNHECDFTKVFRIVIFKTFSTNFCHKFCFVVDTIKNWMFTFDECDKDWQKFLLKITILKRFENCNFQKFLLDFCKFTESECSLSLTEIWNFLKVLKIIIESVLRIVIFRSCL